MAKGHGSSRVGTGKRKKALVDKPMDGNPGKQKLTVVDFSDTAKLKVRICRHQKNSSAPPRKWQAEVIDFNFYV